MPKQPKEDSPITTVILTLIVIWLASSVTFRGFEVKEQLRHNKTMESIESQYKADSIKVSNQFNEEVKNLGN